MGDEPGEAPRARLIDLALDGIDGDEITCHGTIIGDLAVARSRQQSNER